LRAMSDRTLLFGDVEVEIGATRRLNPEVDLSKQSAHRFEDLVRDSRTEVTFRHKGEVAARRCSGFNLAHVLLRETANLQRGEAINVDLEPWGPWAIAGEPEGDRCLLCLYSQFPERVFASWNCTPSEFEQFARSVIAEIEGSMRSAGLDLARQLSWVPPLTG